MAKRCAESGEEKVILTALCGHGHFDMVAYERYLSGEMTDFDLPQDRIDAALANLPRFPAPDRLTPKCHRGSLVTPVFRNVATRVVPRCSPTQCHVRGFRQDVRIRVLGTSCDHVLAISGRGGARAGR